MRLPVKPICQPASAAHLLPSGPMPENSSVTVVALKILLCFLNDKESSFQENQIEVFISLALLSIYNDSFSRMASSYHRFVCCPYKWRYPLCCWALSSNDKWGLSAYVFPALCLCRCSRFVFSFLFACCVFAGSAASQCMEIKRSPFAEFILLALIGGASKHPLFLSSVWHCILQCLLKFQCDFGNIFSQL